MVSYVKPLECCLAHSRVSVRMSYYFNYHFHNQYGLGTFSFGCWSLKVSSSEKQILYANTYIWNLKKKGSKEPRGRTGIKTQT